MTDGPRLVLLVGAPRSGTTWLQTLLGAHPEVATPQETDVFSRYVQPLAEAWTWQRRGTPDAWRERRFKGLPAVLTNDEYRALVREFVDGVVDRMAALAPGASVVLEKSPSHSLCADVLADYASRTKILHLVRDGRDVARSLVAAGNGWGSGWAPRTLRDAARTWVRHVEGADEYRKLGFAYREVRYEALVDGDADALRDAYAFCGLDVDLDDCKRHFEEHRLEAMAGGNADPIVIGGEFGPYATGRQEPTGFFGEGGAGGWRETWDASDRLLFRAVAGDLLVKLGYEPNGRWAASTPRSLAFGAGVLGRRALAAAARRVGRGGERLAARVP